MAFSGLVSTVTLHLLEILTVFHNVTMFTTFKFLCLLDIGLTCKNLILGVTDNYFILIFDTVNAVTLKLALHYPFN